MGERQGAKKGGLSFLQFGEQCAQGVSAGGGRFDDAGERGEVSAVMYIVCDEVESSTYTGPGENRAAVDRAGGKL